MPSAMARFRLAVIACESDQTRPPYSVWNFTPVSKSVKALLIVFETMAKSIARSLSFTGSKSSPNCGKGSSS